MNSNDKFMTLIQLETKQSRSISEVLFSTGGTAMRNRALTVLRARQLIVEQLIVRRELS